MNRFKLVLVLIILGLIGILLAQNRQKLPLKFLCPDVADPSCLYQTPALPLGIWLLIFAIAGIVSSLIWQFLIQTASSPSASKSSKNYSDTYNKTEQPFSRPQVEYTPPRAKVQTTASKPVSDWEQANNEDWVIDETKPDIREQKIKNYEVRTKPPQSQNTDPSSSVYSYKFREASPKKTENLTKKNLDKTDEVYDASYRTINNPQPSKPQNIEEDEEEWI